MIMAKSMICADSTENVGETVRFLLPLCPRIPLGETPLEHLRGQGFDLHPISEVIRSQEERQSLLGIDSYLQTAGGGLGQYYDPFEEQCPYEMVACLDNLGLMLNTHSNEMGWPLPEQNVAEGSSDSSESGNLEDEESPMTDGERMIESTNAFNDDATLQKVLADVYVLHTKATIPVVNLGRKVKVQLCLPVEKKIGKVVIDFSTNTIRVYTGRRKRAPRDFKISDFFEHRDWITLCGDEHSRVDQAICKCDDKPYIDRKPKELELRTSEAHMGVYLVASVDGYRVAYDKAGKQLYKLRHLKHSDVIGDSRGSLNI
jgi:hypothetical protein